MHVRCEDCNGSGTRTDGCFANDPYAPVTTCEWCHGTGEREAMPLDYDGCEVVVRATGFKGTCSVFGERTIIVMNDNEEEVVVASIEELEP